MTNKNKFLENLSLLVSLFINPGSGPGCLCWLLVATTRCVAAEGRWDWEKKKNEKLLAFN